MPNDQQRGRASNASGKRRLSWVLRTTGASLKIALARDTSEQAVRLLACAGDDLDQALGQMIMEQADPTTNKRFTPWLVREYAAGRLILEDLGSANDTLTLFQRYARRLKPEQRDIQRYDNLASAWQAVREFAERDEIHSNRAQKALDRARAYAESRILRQDPDGFTVAVPLTEFAAKWWGRGTRWCTAAEKENAFWDYHQKAPLVVILAPDIGKFQLWVTEADFQFMDAADQPLSDEICRVLWPRVGPLLLAALEKNGSMLEFIPEEQRAYGLCLTAVQQDGRALGFVPNKHRTQDLCLAAVRQNGGLLHLVPYEHRDLHLCLAAVQQNGRALELVPHEHRTYDLCLAAVQQTGGALVSVPEEHRTYDLCLAAVRQNGSALYLVPQEHSTYNLCLTAVQQSGWALQWVPQEHQTPVLCLSAVQQDGWVMYFVPHEQRTYEICLAAVQENGRAVEWVPEEHKTRDLCLAAVQQDGEALQWVPRKYQTYDLCLSAVQQDGMALEWVPTEHKTQDLYLAALEKNRSVIAIIPAHLRAELLAKRPPAPERTPSWDTASWDLDILTTWAERLKEAPQMSMVQNA